MIKNRDQYGRFTSKKRAYRDSNEELDGSYYNKSKIVSNCLCNLLRLICVSVLFVLISPYLLNVLGYFKKKVDNFNDLFVCYSQEEMNKKMFQIFDRIIDPSIDKDEELNTFFLLYQEYRENKVQQILNLEKKIKRIELENKSKLINEYLLKMEARDKSNLTRKEP
jgi:hypothetical protein